MGTSADVITGGCGTSLLKRSDFSGDNRGYQILRGGTQTGRDEGVGPKHSPGRSPWEGEPSSLPCRRNRNPNITPGWAGL